MLTSAIAMSGDGRYNTCVPKTTLVRQMEMMNIDLEVANQLENMEKDFATRKAAVISRYPANFAVLLKLQAAGLIEHIYRWDLSSKTVYITREQLPMVYKMMGSMVVTGKYPINDGTRKQKVSVYLKCKDESHDISFRYEKQLKRQMKCKIKTEVTRRRVLVCEAD